MNLGDTIQPPLQPLHPPLKLLSGKRLASGGQARACRAAIPVSRGPGDSSALASLPPKMLFPPPQPASEGPAPQRHCRHALGPPFSGPTPAHPLLPFFFPTNPGLRPVSPNQVHSPGPPPGRVPPITEEGGQEPWTRPPCSPLGGTPRIRVTSGSKPPQGPVTPGPKSPTLRAQITHPRAQVTPRIPVTPLGPSHPRIPVTPQGLSHPRILVTPGPESPQDPEVTPRPGSPPGSQSPPGPGHPQIPVTPRPESPPRPESLAPPLVSPQSKPAWICTTTATTPGPWAPPVLSAPSQICWLPTEHPGSFPESPPLAPISPAAPQRPPPSGRQTHTRHSHTSSSPPRLAARSPSLKGSWGTHQANGGDPNTLMHTHCYQHHPTDIASGPGIPRHTHTRSLLSASPHGRLCRPGIRPRTHSHTLTATRITLWTPPLAWRALPGLCRGLGCHTQLHFRHPRPSGGFTHLGRARRPG